MTIDVCMSMCAIHRVSGSTRRDSSAGYSYGTLGTASSSNQPGARSGHGFAADLSGMLWMVGGTGIGSGSSSTRRLNDVWRYDVTASMWTWYCRLSPMSICMP
jgi:hypothetical protein